jgi:hypothetical protein
MDAREEKALQIAAKSKLIRNGNVWLVPSQSSPKKYTVNPDPKSLYCTCPDFECRRARCKHIFAVEYTIQREYSDDGQTQTITETVTVKKTYKQEWPAYNKAQTNEKDQFQKLLHELCKGIGEPSQKMGRPRLPLEDMIFSACFKVYSTVSGRRFMCDLRDAQGKGYITKTPHYNSIFNYLEDEKLGDYLKMMIVESSLPLQTIERDFAVDSSGFSTSRFIPWMRAKYTEPYLIQQRQFIKCHIMCGVKTNIITAVEITEGHAGDSPQFVPLVETTATNFIMDEVSADKAYSSGKNLKMVCSKAAMPYIPFKSNATGCEYWGGSIWKRMFHFYSYNTEQFMEHYHKRSNVETTFSMIKAKFGNALRSKSKKAQINEALCKVLCHNICCLIQSMYELNVKPDFWEAA